MWHGCMQDATYSRFGQDRVVRRNLVYAAIGEVRLDADYGV
jgi:hypothetical protein